jgi:hypothetical protein
MIFAEVSPYKLSTAGELAKHGRKILGKKTKNNFSGGLE